MQPVLSRLVFFVQDCGGEVGPHAVSRRSRFRGRRTTGVRERQEVQSSKAPNPRSGLQAFEGEHRCMLGAVLAESLLTGSLVMPMSLVLLV